MKAYIVLLFLSTSIVVHAQTFEFVANNSREVTIGKPAPDQYASPMNAKKVSFKNNVLTITIVSTGKVYSKDNVVRVIEFKKDNGVTYALEVKDSDGIFNYYLYTLNKSASGDSQSLIIPYVVKGRLITEETYME